MSLITTITVLSLVGLGALVLWAWADYRQWIALGPGGLPPTLMGWLRLLRYRLHMRDPFRITPSPGTPSSAGLLGSLPLRGGPRPRVAPYPIPHRHLNQYAATQSRSNLQRVFDACVDRHADRVQYRLSYFEKHSPAITLRHTGYGHADAQSSHGEIAHIHPFDGSMHMIFSEADANLVIQSGWGERNPLAGVMLGIPGTYLFIYPPRDEIELSVAARLVEAAISHMAQLHIH